VQASTSTGNKSKKEIQHMSKHSFLDMIKSAAAEKSKDTSDKKQESQSKWKVLKDDYMMNSKLKDWDKASSEEDGEGDVSVGDGVGRVDDDWSDEGSSGQAKSEGRKRAKIRTR
jgi:hypothetical protein